MSVEILVAKADPIKRLTGSDEVVRLDYLHGWDKAEEKQRAFLSVYFDMYPKKIQTAMKAGIPVSLYQRWQREDKNFIDLLYQVEQLHQENLSAIHYAEAYVDSKIRKGVLQGIGAKGYEKKSEPSKVTNNNLTINTASDFLKSLDD